MVSLRIRDGVKAMDGKHRVVLSDKAADRAGAWGIFDGGFYLGYFAEIFSQG